jgi:hypothetical protein
MRIHLSKKPIRKLKNSKQYHQTIPERERSVVKPSGLWFGYNNGWIEWAIENMGLEKEDFDKMYKYKVIVNKKNNILVLHLFSFQMPIFINYCFFIKII